MTLANICLSRVKRVSMLNTTTNQKDKNQIEEREKEKTNVTEKEEDIDKLVDDNTNTSKIVEMKDSSAEKDNQVKALESDIVTLKRKEVNLNGKVDRFTRIMKNMIVMVY